MKSSPGLKEDYLVWIISYYAGQDIGICDLKSSALSTEL